jgi:hypothetical protein
MSRRRGRQDGRGRIGNEGPNAPRSGAVQRQKSEAVPRTKKIAEPGVAFGCKSPARESCRTLRTTSEIRERIIPVRWPLLLGAVLVGLLAAGCGGSKAYDVDKTRACLKARPGVTVSNDVDFIASTAPAGAFTAKLLGNQVTLSFGDDRDEAERIVRGYQHAAGKNIGLTDVLRPKNNVVILWKAHPSDTAEETIQECLK